MDFKKRGSNGTLDVSQLSHRLARAVKIGTIANQKRIVTAEAYRRTPARPKAN